MSVIGDVLRRPRRSNAVSNIINYFNSRKYNVTLIQNKFVMNNSLAQVLGRSLKLHVDVFTFI